MARIFFAGIKHSGKTGMARLVSGMLGIEAADADDLVLPLIAPMSVREFYLVSGKDAFMEKEAEAVGSYIAGHGSFIMSLGGGACDNSRLISLVRESGRIVYLRRQEEDMLPVILKHGVPAFLDPDDLQGSFHDLYQRRDALYRTIADLVLDLGPYTDKAATARMIAAKLEENGYV